MKKILFTKSSAEFVLKAFDIHLNDDGFLIDNENSLVKTIYDETIHIDDFGGIVKALDGSTIFIKKSLEDIIRYEDLLIRRNKKQS